MARRTPSFEEVVLGGGIVDIQVCDERRVHAVDAEATWALLLSECGHVALLCSACKRDVELTAAGLGMRHAEPCGQPSLRWRWEKL